MKKWKKYLRNSGGIFLLLFGFAQCNLFNLGDKEEVFDPYEHPLLATGDTLVFQSNNDVDSFYVSESEVYKPHLNPASSESDVTQYCGNFHEMGANDTTQLCFDVFIYEKEYITYSYLCYYYYYGGEDNWVFDSVEKENGNYSFTIGDHVLDNLYKLEWFRNEDKVFEGKADSVLYSKDYGLIRYRRFGEEYQLSVETLEMLMGRE